MTGVTASAVLRRRSGHSDFGAPGFVAINRAIAGRPSARATPAAMVKPELDHTDFEDGLLPLHSIQFQEILKPATLLGAPGRLKWLPIVELYIDPRYQRPMNAAGRKNISRIVKGFNWALFSPLVVACRGKGSNGRDRYAIIDGQHRATGAKTHGGIADVPCLIITGGPEAEARAFAIINGQVTSVLPVQIHNARVMAGEPEALALNAACVAAGVRILRGGNGSVNMRAGDTMAVGTLESCLSKFGRDTLITALQCVTETHKGNPGLLNTTVISGLCEVLDGNRAARDAGEALFAAIEKGGGIAVLEHRARASRLREGGALKAHFVAGVRGALVAAKLEKVAA